MFKHFSMTEKLAVIVASCVLATGALLGVFQYLTAAPAYPDFVVGNITWAADSKLQDLLAVPVFVLVLFAGFAFLSRQIQKQRTEFGDVASETLARQIIWWSMPSFAAIFTLHLRAALDGNLFMISAAAIIFMAVWSSRLSARTLAGTALSIFLVGLIPLELGLLLGRLPMRVTGGFDLNPFIKAMPLIFALGLILGSAAAYFPAKLEKIFPRAILIGQVGLTLLFLSLYPARLLQPDGTLTKYQTTVWLKILVLGMIVLGIVDVVRRFRRHSADARDWTKLLSPIAFFALLLGFKHGVTIPPNISSDDYHLGENLLGWWSYLQHSVIYVDHIPAHGFVDDNLRQLFSQIFYDGSPGSLEEVRRLSLAALGLTAFLSMYYFSGSLGLALVSTFFGGIKPTWLFLTPFLCLWLSRSLAKRPGRWLSLWLLSAPAVIIGGGQHGLMLVAAFGIMAVHFLVRFMRNQDRKSWTEIGISLGVLAILGLSTPLFSVLFGVFRYILDNGPINQVAHAVAWRASNNNFVFELIRMSWVATVISCIAVIIRTKKNRRQIYREALPAFVVLLYLISLLPYVMGRIDGAGVSRQGIAANLTWTVLLPIIVWRIFRPRHRTAVILMIACMTASLDFNSLNFKNLTFAAASQIDTGLIRDGNAVGLPNLGRGQIEDAHWNRLTKLNALFSSKLANDETYLDLTSRNAQYFYLNRRPPIPVTAPYNMASPAQQKRAIGLLVKDLPRLALLEGDNVDHDGGGLALRNPYLYRFVMDNYTPRYEDGFIVGYRNAEKVNTVGSAINLAIKNLNNGAWSRGVSTSERAIVVEDVALMPFFALGAKVRLADGHFRKIHKVHRETGTLWLDGPALDPLIAGAPQRLQIVITPEMDYEYRVTLLQKAFAQVDFKKVPVAWGRSEATLKQKMVLVQNLDDSTPKLHQLTAEKSFAFRVAGAFPQLAFDISKPGLSGRDAGLLRFEFVCHGRRAEPQLRAYWWGDNPPIPTADASVKFYADNGVLIVPLDATPRWLNMNSITGVRLDLENAHACDAVTIKDVRLFQRVLN